tara:strand:- start:57249 stop:57794 length:546 start_codon:yes stop_codon:yes gene_type:complete
MIAPIQIWNRVTYPTINSIFAVGLVDMILKKFSWHLWLLIFVLGWSACAPDPSCSDIYLPYVTASFYTVNDAGVETVESVQLDSLWADDADTLLYADTTLSIYGLYVNPEAASTTYHFCLNDTCNSVTFAYDRKEYLISPDCGPRFRFQNLTTEFEGFYDSVIVNKPELTLLGEVNVKIYR